MEAKAGAFEEIRNTLKEDISEESFMGIIQRIEEINRLAYRIHGFANLLFAGDTQDQKAQSLMMKTDQIMATLSNQIVFFDIWWKKLPETVAERLMNASGDYRYWLEKIRSFKDFTLTEAEEKIINIKDVTGSSALNMLYDSITNRYTFKLDVDGEEKELTRGELMVYVQQADPDLRARAYQELYRVFGEDGAVLGQIYQYLVRDWQNEQIQLRGFSSPIASRNLVNDIPDKVVDTLLEVCEKNTDIFQRYFKLKARHLKVDQIQRYDVYAPVAKSNKTYSFEQGTEMVLKAYAAFDEQVASMAQRVFDADHLDSEVRKGKMGGAFCMSVLPELTPWVLTNFQGKANDIATLAHELGHAVHSMLAADHTMFTFQSSLPLAETASTFGEMLLLDSLLAAEDDESVRRDMLFKQIDDAYATIQRQAFFALFERQAHEMVQSGASVDELADAYLENLKNQFGDSVSISDEFRWEWVSIPHIYNVPFYVYAYTFGQLLVFSLYKQYQQEGDAFKPRFLKILSAGGSQAPVRLLSDAGIDVYKSAFWQGGFDVIRELVEQLETMPLA
ncbi:MAG: M3 family oligoendopeptidase [Anaerolineaceae bacterium]|nr:M3 family oligoendopeptidase [Anaerolineaceae bacterium]